MKKMEKVRCFGGKPGQNLYAAYHDHEWGVPVYDERKLFEMLILEGAQAGLNFETILKKRDGYRAAFFDFDVDRVARMTDKELEKCLQNPTIIRNRLKVFSARKNACVFQGIQNEFGDFQSYIWGGVDHKPIMNQWKTLNDVPTQTDISLKISKDLKKRGMTFVGPVIMYAYMQAVGMVNDHLMCCHTRNGALSMI